MKNISALVMLAVLSSVSPASLAQNATAAVNQVLDDYHAAAAAGDWPRYFDLMADDGVFLGSDASERWPKAEFQRYASASKGWKYTPQSRHINFTPDGNTAWFDELLDSASYGSSRGSGVLIQTGSGWKISQYNLTFPIPNELVRDITDSIKAFEEIN